MLTDRKKGDNM